MNIILTLSLLHSTTTQCLYDARLPTAYDEFVVSAPPGNAEPVRVRAIYDNSGALSLHVGEGAELLPFIMSASHLAMVVLQTLHEHFSADNVHYAELFRDEEGAPITLPIRV